MPSLEEERIGLVKRLESIGILRSERTKRAALLVKRELFVPPKLRKYAYRDTPLPIGHGQTISAPHMVFMMNELLDLREGMLVFEVGSGSGYHAATVAEMISPGGKVITSEILEPLAKFAWENLRRAGYHDRVSVVACDGSKGLKFKRKPERILVTAAAPRVPRPLVEMLEDGGKIVIPVGDTPFFAQKLVLIEKKGSRIMEKAITDVAFVPLRGEWGFR